MSEDRNRLAKNDDGEQTDDDVEAHRLVAKNPTIEENSDDSDAVEAHALAPPPVRATVAVTRN
jgi:hypothetical protein